jgi:hypothetical protein
VTSWLERRRERRRRRKRAEELASWFILPIVLIIGWWIGAQVYSLVREPAAALLRLGDPGNAPR